MIKFRLLNVIFSLVLYHGIILIFKIMLLYQYPYLLPWELNKFLLTSFKQIFY